ncbi:MAG: N-acetyltransferase [Amycolatopsis sp.]|jgi:predicted N-acetyltransferase YhbS|uniref:GNAT family N-acetyltransferase n=1 Tax=Amycolatopsis sp. TaxID=37632 RepID=UPI002630E874|nr:GNAT family N-acetyltransferase [Amycolatopsis sp.]MCU1685882.1 N-acetyltransferase [Amycolatopsis sp.]
MTRILVRAAVAGDAERVFALLTGFATSHRPLLTAFDTTFPELVRLTASGAADLLVAEAGRHHEVVGYALAFRLLTLHANGPIVELQELMVAPASRNEGIGGELVLAVVDRARAGGAVEVTVPTRRARDYYLRLGFEDTAVYLKRSLA